MPAPHHSVFYRLDALPATQPTASRHWRHFQLSVTDIKSEVTALLLLLLLLLQLFYGCTQVSRYQKGKTNLDLLEQEIVSGRGIRWDICKFASHPDRQPRQHPTTQKSLHMVKVFSELSWICHSALIFRTIHAKRLACENALLADIFAGMTVWHLLTVSIESLNMSDNVD